MFTGEFILGMKRKALRKGIWYRVLDHVERGILSLTSRIVDRVESVVLGVTLVKIFRKLRDALKREVIKQMEFSIKRARKIAEQAVAWGYHGAESWATDNDFIRYLLSLKINRFYE